jgi:adenylate cyclase
MIPKKQIHIFFLPLTVIVFVVAVYYMQLGVIESFEAKTYDLRFKTLRGALKPNPKIALITIDEKSIAELGRFPWSRKYFKELVDTVSKAPAKAVLLDVLFPESESPQVDKNLADSIKHSGITTLSVIFELSENGQATGITNLIPELHNTPENIAHINITPDEDGVIRWTPLVIPYKGKFYPSLALAGAKEALEVNNIDVKDYEIILGNKTIPTDSLHRMLINYTGPAGIYERYSFSDVIKGRIKPEELKDRILIVGATALGIYDLRVTPFSNNTPGIEVNANIIDNILRGDFLQRGGIEALIDIICIVFFGIIASLITSKFRAFTAAPLILCLMAAHIYLAYYLFLKGHWVTMIYPIASITLSYSVTASLRFFTVEKKAREIKSMFSSYVSKKIVDELISHPEKAKVGGEIKTITILFCDVKGYTSFSEKHNPQEVVRILNEYLAEMTDTVMKYDGTLDKFMGDGILAFWGAPLEQKNHAELAVRCSLEMLRRLDALYKKWQSEGTEPLTCGIGINTGEVIVGNIGVEGKKMEYTAIGDSVNLTYRIQDMSRKFNRPLITENLYRLVRDIVKVEPLGSVTVRGKHEAVNIYALIDIVEKETL